MSLSEYSAGSGPIFFRALDCGGTEQKLIDCPGSLGIHTCTHSQDVVVICPGKNHLFCYSHSNHLNKTVYFYLVWVFQLVICCCIDENECLVEGRCGGNSICINTPGSFHCVCQDGYQGDPNIMCTGETVSLCFQCLSLLYYMQISMSAPQTMETAQTCVSITLAPSHVPARLVTS